MCLFTAWVGYPLGLALARPRPLEPGAAYTGDLAIVVVARDEGRRIAARIAELRALEVPAGCAVRVVIVDDGSRDDTLARAREAAAAAHPIAVDVVAQAPSGKAVGLATGVAHARDAGVVVFADVRQAIPPTALVALVAPFADPAVGVVSGVVVKPVTHGAGLYWRYESWVRRLESRTGSTVGATGPWYAVRRELFVAPPRGLLLDDVWVPMQAVFRGARAVVAEDAIVVDVEHPPALERDKKARTLTGNLQLLEAWPALLDPRENPLWARFFAHKVLRLATPYRGNAVALWRWARRDFRWAS